MEYYSDIKRNTRESVPVKWMNLEPIIQSEVATKRKTNIGNAGLDEAQAGIKIAGINNLRYADDITLMAESKEELKSLLVKVKEESEKADLKLNIQKMKVPSLHGK